MKTLDHHVPIRAINYFFPIAIVIAILVVYGMFSSAAIQHDDWPFIIGDRNYREKLLLHEGRPLTFLWYTLSSHVLTPLISSVSYWLLFVYISIEFSKITQAKSITSVFFWLGLALSSVQVLQLSGWPSYTLSGLATTALAVTLIDRIGERGDTELAVLVVLFAFFIFQFYPGFAFVILFAAIAHQRCNDLTSAAKVLLGFVVGILTSTLIIFLVNYSLFGIFDVVPPSWRKFHYATDLSSFMDNLNRPGAEWRTLLQQYTFMFKSNVIVLIVAAVGFIHQLVVSRTKLFILLAAGLVPLLLDILLVGLTGIVPPLRHYVWVPFFFGLLASPLVEQIHSYFKVAIVFLITATGVALVKDHVQANKPCDMLYHTIQHIALLNDIDRVIFASGRSDQGTALAYRLAYSGRKTRACNGESECREAEQGQRRVFLSPTGKEIFVNIGRSAEACGAW